MLSIGSWNRRRRRWNIYSEFQHHKLEFDMPLSCATQPSLPLLYSTYLSLVSIMTRVTKGKVSSQVFDGNGKMDGEKEIFLPHSPVAIGDEAIRPFCPSAFKRHQGRRGRNSSTGGPTGLGGVDPRARTARNDRSGI